MDEQKNTPKVRTRIAPSPTGYPHIGTIYQALFNYAFAKKYNGEFLVRIEDTDRSRFVEGAEDVIFSALDWFKLTEDESPRNPGHFAPYRQSERLDIYQRYVHDLLNKDKAYWSYYRKEEAGQKKDYSYKPTLEVKTQEVIPEQKPPESMEEWKNREDRENWVIKMRVPKDTVIKVHDEIRGEIEFGSNQVTEQVLLKSDGFPTYHLAVVIDDHLMEISHIVRAEEWISSFPKHTLLYEYFGWKMPPVYHTATLRNPDKSKLSKRHGHTDVNWYKEDGYLPEAILNYLALLGWSHPEEKEIFSLSEFIQLFDLKDVKPIAPIFDLTKLTWMNGEYIRMKSNEELRELLINFYNNDEIVSRLMNNNPNTNKILEITKTRIKTLKEFKPLVKFLIEQPDSSSLNEEHYSVIPRLRESLESIPKDEWESNKIFEAIKTIMEDTKSKKMPTFYQIFTGNKQGLPLFDALVIIGRDETLERLDKLVK